MQKLNYHCQHVFVVDGLRIEWFSENMFKVKTKITNTNSFNCVQIIHSHCTWEYKITQDPKPWKS